MSCSGFTLGQGPQEWINFSWTSDGNRLLFLFKGDSCKVFDADGNLILRVGKVDNLYPIINQHVVTIANALNVSFRLSVKQLQHERMGHPSKGFPFDETLGPCIGCTQGKLSKAPFSGSWKTAHQPPESFHTDLMGPFPTPSLSGSRYVQMFINGQERRKAKVSHCILSQA